MRRFIYMDSAYIILYRSFRRLAIPTRGVPFGSHVQIINKSIMAHFLHPCRLDVFHLSPSKRCAIPAGYTVPTIPSGMLADIASLAIVFLMFLLCACVYGCHCQ